MRIGIGITTTSNRPDHLKLCVSQIEKHTKDYVLHIAKDFTTIAKAKNDCLFHLKDCDHIFLFDDDCFPIQDGWIDFFINSGIEHSLYLTQRHNYIGLNEYKDCGGCFIYLNKKTLNRVGYFNSAYKQYAFEHAGYSQRISKGNYICLHGTEQYLYSLDYQGEGNWGIKHKPSIIDYQSLAESIEYNRQIFLEEINGDKIYYEYQP